MKKLGFPYKEVGRLTLRRFNQFYQCYKDEFDKELSLYLTHKTYAMFEKEYIVSQEWF